jgi:putative ABC transport system permease protein
VLHDVRIALRSLLRAPAFTMTTVLTLALAAGANAAILAVVYGVLVKPLPFPDADRLVAVWPGRFQSNANLLYTRERGAMFSQVAAVAPGWTMALTGAGEPAKLTVAKVSGNLFDTFGTQPILGRTFTEDAARSGSDGVVVLGYDLWTKRFGGDPGVIGRTIQLDGRPVQVVAVMPRTFEVFGLKTDAYTPFAMDAAAWYHQLSFSLYAARLAPGRTLEQANSDYRALLQDLRRERKYPDDFGRTASVVPMREALVGDVSSTLIALGGAVGLILLIAGANVGTLQLGRAAARARDVAIRSALGASRTRIVRQLAAENVILALTGGVLGVVVARAALPALLSLIPRETPRLQEIALDPLVAGAVIAAATIVGLSVGLIPALGSTRLRTAPLLRLGASSETRGAKRLRASLVSVEVALAVVLSIGAGLMLQTLWKLQRVDPGFRPDGVLTLHVQPTGEKYADISVADFYNGLLERVRALPGVTAAGAIQHLPFSGYSWNIPLRVEGHVVPVGTAPPTAGGRLVSADYFAAIGQPLLAGRAIERTDAGRTDVAVVNEALASRFFGSAGAAVGRRLRQQGVRELGPWMTIVGVVASVRHTALTTAPEPEVYTHIPKQGIASMMLAVRTDGDPLSLVPMLREGIWSIDRDLPLSDIETMEAKIGASLARPRLLLTMLVAFAVLGGMLAVVGVYGVVAYSVSQRRRELGIMVALGAQRGRLMRAVLREALLYGAAGLALGIPVAVAGSRLMETLVFGVSATDPATYGAIGLATLLTVVAASLLPALRASRVDPVSALKGN